MKISFLFLVCILLVAPPVRADSDVLTLDEAVREVLSTNPDVQAASYRVDAAQAKVPQAKALKDPMIGVEFYNVPIDTIDVTKGEDIDYKIRQEFPFPGKRSVLGKAAQFDAQAVHEMSRGRIQDVLLEVKNTYYDLYRIDRSLEVNRESQKLLKLFLASTETAYATGKSSAEAPLKAQVELSKLENQEILLTQERITHGAHLQALLNRPSHRELRLPSQLSWPTLKLALPQVIAMAHESRPELKALDAMEQRDQAKVTSAKQSLIPDFSLQFAYKQRTGDQQDVWAAESMINFPLLYLGKKRGEIHEAKASLKATEAEQTSLHLHTRHDIEAAYSGFRSAEKLVSSYRQVILPQAKTTLEAAKTAYESGKVDFLTLIDAALTYRDLQMSFYDTQARQGMAFATLERLVGKNLDRM